MLRLPTIKGVIDRRILANYRIDPAVIARLLPKPFAPQIVNGFAIAGICLIRLKQIRPRFLPLPIGISSENAAHRIAVEWQVDGETQQGVYIPRRDTSSRLNSFAGGRFFPGVHHRARFDVTEKGDFYRVAMRSKDDSARMLVEARVCDAFPSTSIFASLEEVSSFFKNGSLGYSPGHQPDEYDGLELESIHWKVSPLHVERMESTFFDDEKSFPPGSVEFDCALLMTDIKHLWHSRPSVCCESATAF